MNKVFTQSENFKSEYSCAVVRVGELTPVEDSDFLAKTNIFGTQIVVRKDQVKEGDIMIYAANETQLNERFLSVNNLFEIDCREKNSNAAEVAAIMAEYEPIKAEADKKRGAAKALKAKMESHTAKAAKMKRKIAKNETRMAEMDPDSPDYATLADENIRLNEFIESATAKAVACAAPYAQLKKEIADIVKSGEHIVAEAKKHCGFFNKHGRVRCLKLRCEPSFGFLFSPEELFKFNDTITMEDVLDYEGQEFDTVCDELFVKVYVPPIKEPAERSNKNKAQNRVNRFDRMISGEFFLNYETAQFAKNLEHFHPEDVVDISVKMHGTSAIFAKVHVREPIKLPFFKRIWNKFVDATGWFKSKRITDYNVVYGPVYSSRKVIVNEYINADKGPGFYEKDIYSEWGDKIYPYLDDGMTIYGEICGYFDNKLTKKGKLPIIQTQYDYGCKYVEGEIGESIFMPYRITTTKEDGSKVEWEVSEVKTWTKQVIDRMKATGDETWNFMHPIDVLYHGTLEDLYPELDTENHWHENLLEKMSSDKEHFGMEENEPMCTTYESPREGICIRKNNEETPSCFKLKTTAFSFGEAIRMDNGDVDMEMEEGYAEDNQ